MLNGKSCLITGGTGYLGQALVRNILEKWPHIRKIIVFSRDEEKQFLMNQTFPISKYPCLRYCIGDVRDYGRLEKAMKDVDVVIHTAAMKYVDIAEHNPMECIKTNVLGAENVINACLENKVKRVVSLSTDKASAPINLYGASKLASDKLFIAANNIKGAVDIRFSVVRYGNVMASNGSVIPFFLKKRSSGILPITDPNMTRFNISLQEGVEMVFYALEYAWGGELLVPKIPSYRIVDLAEAIGPNCEHQVVGIRPGEKVHEEMITQSDSYLTYNIGKYYSILPPNPTWPLENYLDRFGAKKIREGYSYNSRDNDSFLDINALRSLIVQHVDSSFLI